MPPSPRPLPISLTWADRPPSLLAAAVDVPAVVPRLVLAPLPLVRLRLAP
jgi:hypothetical protein